MIVIYEVTQILEDIVIGIILKWVIMKELVKFNLIYVTLER